MTQRELVVQLVRASHSSVCRAGRHRFEPRPAHKFLSVFFNLYNMRLLSYSVHYFSAQVKGHKQSKGNQVS